LAVSKIVVGLGNPGRQYEKTRHNLGFMVLAAMARAAGVEWKKSRQGEALAAEVTENGEGILFLLPLTYMNLSGQAVGAVAHFNKVTPDNILVVVDDIRLDPGDVRLRRDGSDGGHNGLKSITSVLGTNSYPRLRLGVGAPPPKMDQADFVLSEFSAREAESLPAFISAAADCAVLWMRGEADRAMTVYNQRKGNKDNEQI